MEDQELTGLIIGCAMKVHGALGPGFLESVYHNALVHELSKAGIEVQSRKPIDVIYDGVLVGTFVADLFAGRRVIVELKANRMLISANETQLVNYLAATGVEVGLLLNFGCYSLQFKRKYRAYGPSKRQD